jgi:hypothetical protein
MSSREREGLTILAVTVAGMAWFVVMVLWP